MESSPSVLIVGGSLNGLTMAMLLAQRRVPCLVVERHPGTSIQYKFRGTSARSMEIFGYRCPPGAFVDDYERSVADSAASSSQSRGRFFRWRGPPESQFTRRMA